ncbi:MAG: hypothetical protein K6U80_16185 [Firmicutes bacterium]|nr:hypothetical protein [Bacillota bacterium]
MAVCGRVTFQEALEMVESLPESQQEELIEIVRQHLMEYRQEVFASKRRESRAEFGRGEVKRFLVEDLMRELYCSSPKTWAEKR